MLNGLNYSSSFQWVIGLLYKKGIIGFSWNPFPLNNNNHILSWNCNMFLFFYICSYFVTLTITKVFIEQNSSSICMYIPCLFILMSCNVQTVDCFCLLTNKVFTANINKIIATVIIIFNLSNVEFIGLNFLCMSVEKQQVNFWLFLCVCIEAMECVAW